MTIIVPDPNCPREDCRFQVGVEMTTCVYYPPCYDKYGNNLNPDGNTTSGEMVCSSCGRKWKYSRQYGKTTYSECQVEPNSFAFHEDSIIIKAEDNSEGC